MRTLLLALMVASLGCESASSSDGTAPSDAAVVHDLASGFACGDMSCAAGQQCCFVGNAFMCLASCPDAGITVTCKSPSDCGGNPCCITVGSGLTVEAVMCGSGPSDCPPHIDLATQSGKDRACVTDSDCSAGVMSPELPDCCTNTSTMQKVCFSKAYLQVISGWTCP